MLGLKELATLKKLSKLELEYLPITDRGLHAIAGLTHLKHLDLSGTKTTKAGIAELRKSLPNCTIER